MHDEPLTIWLVTYWRTLGIIDGQTTDDGGRVRIDGKLFACYREGKDWFRTEAEALLKAIELSSAKYLSLYEQAEKVEELNVKFWQRLGEIEKQR